MPSLALIAEGLTDQIVIERLIDAVYEEDPNDPLLVTYAQPLRDRTDAHHAPHAGWQLVLEFCQHSIQDALAANDYVLVHIDTDDGDHVNFGLPLTDCGSDRCFADLIEGATAIIQKKMGDTVAPDILRRIIFAVAVHATESWLLLILFDDHHLKSPFERLSRELRKRDFSLKKEGRIYQVLTNSIKDKQIHKHIDSEHSLGVFLREALAKLPS